MLNHIPVRALALRLPGWFTAIADQGVIAIINLGMSIAVTRLGGVADLGVYSLIAMTTLACLGFVRTLLTDPWLSSRLGADSTEGPARIDARQFGPELRALALLAALACALPTLLVALWSGGGQRAWLLLVLGATLWTLQDTTRYAFYKRSNSWGALSSDSLLLITTACGAALGWGLGRLDLAWLLGSYTTGVAVACLPGLRFLIGPLSFGTAGAWWQAVCRRLGLPLLQDSVAYFISANVSSYLLAGLASAAIVGEVRVVSSLYSPLAMVFTGMSMWLVPALTTRGLQATQRLRAKAMLGLSAAGVLATVVAVAVGPWLALNVFGADAKVSRAALMIGGLSTWLNAMASTWIAAVKVFSSYRPISWARTLSGVAIIPAILVLPFTRGADGYLALLLLQNLAVAATAFLLQRSRQEKSDD